MQKGPPRDNRYERVYYPTAPSTLPLELVIGFILSTIRAANQILCTKVGDFLNAVPLEIVASQPETGVVDEVLTPLLAPRRSRRSRPSRPSRPRPPCLARALSLAFRRAFRARFGVRFGAHFGVRFACVSGCVSRAFRRAFRVRFGVRFACVSARVSACEPAWRRARLYASMLRAQHPRPRGAQMVDSTTRGIDQLSKGLAGAWNAAFAPKSAPAAASARHLGQ